MGNRVLPYQIKIVADRSNSKVTNVLIGGHSIDEEKKTDDQKLIEEQIKSSLTDDYTSIFKINVKTNDFYPYYLDERTEIFLGKKLRSSISYTDAYDYYLNNFVDREYKPRMKEIGAVEYIINELSEKKNFSIEKGMAFSVVPKANNQVAKIFKKTFGFPVPFFNWENYDYKDKIPEITDKIGADLIADLVGAKTYYKSPALIFDLGTVTKLLAVNKEKKFVGASFIPGMNSALTMFSRRTAMLPDHTKLEKAPKEVGISTSECMQHGVYWSTVSYIEKQIELQGKSTIILTGGNAIFVKNEIKNIIYDPDLTLKGMNLMFKELVK